MAKRFTDTDKWDKPWFRKLNPTQKCFVMYCFDKCDRSGVLNIDIEMIEFLIGDKVENIDCIFPENFKIIKMDESNKWFMPDFLKFQYESGLNSNKPAIVSIRKLLLKHNLVNTVNELFGNDYLMINVSLNNDCQIIKDKDKDKDKDKEINKEIETDKDTENKTDLSYQPFRESFTDKAQDILRLFLDWQPQLKLDYHGKKPYLKGYCDLIARKILGQIDVTRIKEAMKYVEREKPAEMTIETFFNFKYKCSGAIENINNYAALNRQHKSGDVKIKTLN